jgi:ATP dependent DNA ligase domain
MRPNSQDGSPATIWPLMPDPASWYFWHMPPRPDGYIPPCNPTRAARPPSGPDWVHEIKHDGYRLIVWRDRGTVRLFTRRGYDWTGRYPAIASTAAKLRASPRMQDLNVSAPRQCRLAAQSCSSGPPPS